MNSVSRKLTLGMIVALGAAACGDDVTVTEQTPPPAPTPVVRSVVVSPSAATIATGGAFTFGAAVDADAGLATTVNWTSSNAAVATVANGVATAAGAGVTSICATSTVDANKSSCAQLTVTTVAAPQPATVEIDAITIGCDAIARALNPVNCSLNAPVATNNVAGEFQVQANVNRPTGSTVTGVKLEVFAVNNGVVATTPEFTQTQTLSQDPIVVEGLAAQSAANRVTFSVQSAAYDTVSAQKVRHLNGQKRIKVSLVGNNATASADRDLTFRNANGFHITTTTSFTGNNAAGFAIRQTRTADASSWVGGTSLTFKAIPISYTGVAAQTVAITFGGACDLQVGGGARTATTTLAAGAATGTLAYTNGSTASLPTTVNSYEYNPACTGLGDVPSANGVDANGNPFINIALGGNFGATNTLNNPAGPVDATLVLAPALRLDNRAPTSAITLNLPGPNGRTSNWFNDAVILNGQGALTTNNLITAASTHSDAGIGTVAFAAQAGTTLALAQAAAPITNTAALAPSATNAGYTVVVYSRDGFGNRVMPAALGAQAATFGVDRAAPQANYDATSLAANARLNLAAIGGEFVVTAVDTGLVGNSGMAPTNPMSHSIQRRNFTADPFCYTGGAGCPLVTTGLTVAAPLISTNTLTAEGTNGYYVFNATVRDAAGNTTTLAPRVILLDDVAPVVAATTLPATVSGAFTASATASDDVDLNAAFMGATYAGGFPVGTQTILMPRTAISAYNPTTLANNNVAISQSVTSPLALQPFGGARSLMTGVVAHVWSQTFLQTIGGSGVLTFGTTPNNTALTFPVANWASFAAPTSPAAGVTIGGSAGTLTEPVAAAITARAAGATGVFNNPFSRVDFYAQVEGANGWMLIGSVPAASATLTDDGVSANGRIFSYALTVGNGQGLDANFFLPTTAAGTVIASNIVAVGIPTATTSQNLGIVSAALPFNIRK